MTLMRNFPDPFVAGAVQWAPSVNDAAAGTERACAAIAEAAASDVKLLAFSETWLTGYPYWEGLGPRPDYFDAWRGFVDQAVTVPGPEITQIAACAADHDMHVVIGVNERDPVSEAVFNTLVYIGSDGQLLGKHRKLHPTITERLVWTPGDGSDLDVHDTPLGRLGGLICYEHQMAPARYVLCDMGIQVHVAVWPGQAFLDPVIDAAVRHTSMENACYVVSAREVMSPDRLPDGFPMAEVPGAWDAHGGSSIAGPGALYVTEPVFDVETIVTGVIDVKTTLDTKWWVNGVGNYARPDVFKVVWDRRPKLPVERIEPGN
jgi:nitrilase